MNAHVSISTFRASTAVHSILCVRCDSFFFSRTWTWTWSWDDFDIVLQVCQWDSRIRQARRCRRCSMLRVQKTAKEEKEIFEFYWNFCWDQRRINLWWKYLLFTLNTKYLCTVLWVKYLAKPTYVSISDVRNQMEFEVIISRKYYYAKNTFNNHSTQRAWKYGNPKYSPQITNSEDVMSHSKNYWEMLTKMQSHSHDVSSADPPRDYLACFCENSKE